MEEKRITLSSLDSFSEETAGQDTLRYVGLPELLGEEKDTLLYFLGRKLARNIDYASMDDIFYIFQRLRWGNLDLVKEKKHQITFYLMSDDVVRRLDSPVETEFRLEAGFIAECVQQLFNRPAECAESINNRLYRIEFKVFFTD